MKVILKGVHLTLSERMKAHVQEQLVDPILRFYDDEAAELNIHLVDSNGPKGGTDKECRVTAFMPGLAPVHIVEATDDIYRSVDLARDRLVKTVKRELERRRSTNGHPGKAAEQLAAALGAIVPDNMPVE